MKKDHLKNDNENLFERIKRNDPLAFEKVFRDNYKRLFLFAENFVCDSNVAEDIVQSIFVKLWDTKGPGSISNLEGYLYTSTKNACLTYLSHLQMVDRHKEKLVEALVYSQNITIEEDNELQKKIKDAINKLPPQSQKIIYLKIYEGFKNEEIAEELNISVNTVRTHIFRGYKALKKHLSSLYLITILFN